MNNFFRPKALYPVYPPYHKNDYLEEYFYRKINEDKIAFNRQYIDIFWTNLYCNSSHIGIPSLNIQHELYKKLDWNEKYFTVCQHDDGPFEELPPDTLIFSAGGNRTSGKIIPIPLICDPIPQEIKPIVNKEIFASFVGSMTHPIRSKLVNMLSDKKNYLIKTGQWSASVSNNDFNFFIQVTCRSKFTLCPRGYGATSFRLYEAFQLNSVPVYITNKKYTPWDDELNWDEFCIIVDEQQIDNIDDILHSISDEKYNLMLEIGKDVYNNYFTLDGMYKNICKRIL